MKSNRNLRQTSLLLTTMILFASAHGQTANSWIWMGGNDTAYNYDSYVSPTNYGTMGIPAPANNPGIRESQSGWMDASGNFWFFGGQDINTLYSYSDLWKYSAHTGLWTWVGGSNLPYSPGVYGSAPGPVGGSPAARYGHSCSTDAAGHFWLFGGIAPYPGTPSLGMDMNDLWTYNPTTSQWTWVSGMQAGSYGSYGTKGIPDPTNIPGAREFTTIWNDASGDLWLFGGEGDDAGSALGWGVLNDLWEYTTAGQWVWISGSNTANAGGVYGIQGVGDPANVPPARRMQTGCVDGAGHFWIFGGLNYNGNLYNDLWEYDPGTGFWTWVSGSNGLDDNSVYGTQGIPDGTIKPGGRYGHNMQIDRSGNILIYGGMGIVALGYEGTLNDVWSYNPRQKKWTWLSGTATVGQSGYFGQKGVANPANLPPARFNASSWLDPSNNLWIFGGTTTNPFDAGLDDVWEFAPVTSLPIESVSLQGLPQGDDNLLTWQTVDELNTSTFVIQRSTDGVTFSAIGTVPAAGSGNNSYSYTDTHLPVSKSYYYRLEMKDRNGSTTYSQTILLHGMGAIGLTVYPNPATSSVTIRINDNSLLNTPLRLMDLDGHLITEQIITAQQQHLDLSPLSHGTYLLQFTNGSSVKVLKE